MAESVLQPLSGTRANEWIDTWLLDPALPAGLILFQSPRSFTGQDIAELHLPGSPALLAMTLAKILTNGARQAEPGEFSARAFLHGKLDLTEAEGIAATISARSTHQLRAATSLREGRLHQWVTQYADRVADVLALVEAGIDFSDEPGVTFIALEELQQRLDAVISAVKSLESQAVSWEVLSALPTVVLLGRPNVGKSTLLNTLSGQNRAIVSPIAGTTRDAIAAEMCQSSRSVQLIDVAGVESTHLGISGLMNIARQQTLLRADVILLVVDHNDTPQTLQQLLSEVPLANVWKIIVRGKSDLPEGMHDAPSGLALPWIRVSARNGANLSALRELIFSYAHRQPPLAEDCLTLNDRHRQLLQQAGAALQRARDMLAASVKFPELLAADLRVALDELGGISGTISSDDVLGRIFGSFCIGK